MSHVVRRTLSVLAAATVLSAAAAYAVTPDQLQAEYEAIARKEAGNFTGVSAVRGGEFFRSTHGNDWSCATCHTAKPVVLGRHARTGNVLQPLAPSANGERFTDPVKVEKWFKRHCGDVLGRACTAQEKGDVIAFLRSLN